MPVEGGIPICETSYLRSNCSRPWSNLRRFLAIRDQLNVDPGNMFVNPYLNSVLFA